jgi:excisionase family DNA binding protein
LSTRVLTRKARPPGRKSASCDEIKAKYREFLTTREVAELLRTSPETIRYWAWQGTGPKSFKSGRRRLFAREDVDAYIAEARASVSGGAA